MKTRWDIDKVRKYVNENSECKLITNEYVNIDTKMKFQCKCGNIFETTFDKFKSRNKRQCNECGRQIIANKLKLSYEEVKHFIEVESESGCKLLSKEYKNAQEKLLIQCKCGNTYKVKWSHFKNSNQRQCPKCGIELTAEARRLPAEEVTREIESRGCKLLNTYKNTNTKLKIQCSCGNVYYTLYGLFKDFDYDSCPACREKNKVVSYGQDKIRNWLNDNNINYIEEYTFDDLKNVKALRFDFGIMKDDKLKMLIEYDGKQHYGIGTFSDDTEEMFTNYQRTLTNDFKKNQYCFENGIPLLRIPYNKYNKIESILETTLK